MCSFRFRITVLALKHSNEILYLVILLIQAKHVNLFSSVLHQIHINKKEKGAGGRRKCGKCLAVKHFFLREINVVVMPARHYKVCLWMCWFC